VLRKYYVRDVLTLETAVLHLAEAELTDPGTSWEILVRVIEK